MKKEYTKPEMKISVFTTIDVITASETPPTTPMTLKTSGLSFTGGGTVSGAAKVGFGSLKDE